MQVGSGEPTQLAQSASMTDSIMSMSTYASDLPLQVSESIISVLARFKQKLLVFLKRDSHLRPRKHSFFNSLQVM